MQSIFEFLRANPFQAICLRRGAARDLRGPAVRHLATASLLVVLLLLLDSPIPAGGQGTATGGYLYQLAIMERGLANPALKHLYLDISWDETAKYITASPESVKATAELIEKYPDRFLFGSDVVAPTSIDSPMAVYKAYAPLWKALKPETARKVCLENYERIFDEGRRRVRAWEAANVPKLQ